MKTTIGIASYGNPDKLAATIESIERHTVGSATLRIWHNPGSPQDEECRAVIQRVLSTPKQLDIGRVIYSDSNVGYAGAVNGLLAACDTEYFLYCDNDVEVSPSWDAKLCAVLDAYPEVAQVFPGAGHYGFFNGRYHECLWNAGYCWASRTDARPLLPSLHDGAEDISHGSAMDTLIGHHEEVDLMIRLRMAGYQIAACPDVQVLHHESSTQSPESAKRIHAGVVRWMNKWNRYFVGDAIKYPNPDPDSGEGYDPRALRYTDWPPCALYLERWTLHHFPEWNAHDRRVTLKGYREVQTPAGEMDAIEILKPKGYYRGRAI